MPDPSGRVADLYSRHAAAWMAARRGSPGEAAWLDRFAVCIPPDARVLDLGCGHGRPWGALLAKRGVRVTGLDSSAPLIAQARADLPDQTWIVGDMRAHAGLTGPFGGILAWDSLFHLTPDAQRQALRTWLPLASRGAPLLFTTGPQAGVAIGRWQGAALYHSALSEAEYRTELAQSGFTITEFRREDPQAGGRTICLARRENGGP